MIFTEGRKRGREACTTQMYTPQKWKAWRESWKCVPDWDRRCKHPATTLLRGKGDLVFHLMINVSCGWSLGLRTHIWNRLGWIIRREMFWWKFSNDSSRSIDAIRYSCGHNDEASVAKYQMLTLTSHISVSHVYESRLLIGQTSRTIPTEAPTCVAKVTGSGWVKLSPIRPMSSWERARLRREEEG